MVDRKVQDIVEAALKLTLKIAVMKDSGHVDKFDNWDRDYRIQLERDRRCVCEQPNPKNARVLNSRRSRFEISPVIQRQRWLMWRLKLCPASPWPQTHPDQRSWLLRPGRQHPLLARP
jgi:hypothetical protein